MQGIAPIFRRLTSPELQASFAPGCLGCPLGAVPSPDCLILVLVLILVLILILSSSGLPASPTLDCRSAVQRKAVVAGLEAVAGLLRVSIGEDLQISPCVGRWHARLEEKDVPARAVTDRPVTRRPATRRGSNEKFQRVGGGSQATPKTCYLPATQCRRNAN